MKRLILFLYVLVLFTLIYIILDGLGFITLIKNTDQFKLYILQLGSWGILVIIFLMAFAILFKFLPSALIALASGAAYGHTWGTIYIIIGAWLGAVIAFYVTRLLGKDMICKLLGSQLSVKHQKSQLWLMWGLFISRLIPVIPYDIVSYAMGLSPIQFWRFSIATLAGLIPTSFFLAHVGGELMDVNIQEMLSGMMIAGLLLLFPISIVTYLYYRYGQVKNFISIKKCTQGKIEQEKF
jgi:uncharacterized membrane protein YdjX (TVP38/TMEM64 family)